MQLIRSRVKAYLGPVATTAPVCFPDVKGAEVIARYRETVVFRLAEKTKRKTIMTVTIKYLLSQAGQKAAILAGRPAMATVTESIEFDNPALIEQLNVTGDGKVYLDAASQACYSDTTLYLDAPPVDLAALLDTLATHRSVQKTRREAIAMEVKEREEKNKAAFLAKCEHDKPLVDASLIELEGMALDAALPGSVKYGSFQCDGQTMVATPEQKARYDAVIKARAEYDAKKKEDAAREKEAARAAMIAEHGGVVFAVEGGLCGFKGQGLWNSNQSKRWVGVFTAPKGIDAFLDSARGEFSFAVKGVNRGDCIQGAGFDTNSRGKRRSETEWFGVVVRVDEMEIVVDLQESRSDTIKAAAKLK